MQKSTLVRKDFEEWQVHIAYMRQEGRCANCGGTLDYGMGTGKKDYDKKIERHHKDGDRSNNQTENLELLCKQCHMATLAKVDEEYGKRYSDYLQAKSIQFSRLIQLTEKAIGKELAGTVINSAIELLNKTDKVMMEQYGMHRGIFYAPPSIKALVSVRNMQTEILAMKEGIKIGLGMRSDLIEERRK